MIRAALLLAVAAFTGIGVVAVAHHRPIDMRRAFDGAHEYGDLPA